MIDIYDEFRNLVEAFDRERIPYALCGGLAMAVYGLPRATVDIDMMVHADLIQEAVHLAVRLGFDIEAERMSFVEGTVIIHRHSKTDSESEDLLSLDLIEVTPPLEDTWNRRQKVAWEGGDICVLDRAGLIRMKSLRMSGQDRDDIAFIEESQRES